MSKGNVVALLFITMIMLMANYIVTFCLFSRVNGLVNENTNLIYEINPKADQLILSRLTDELSEQILAAQSNMVAIQDLITTSHVFDTSCAINNQMLIQLKSNVVNLQKRHFPQ
jgi:hypothetical protein